MENEHVYAEEQVEAVALPHANGGIEVFAIADAKFRCHRDAVLTATHILISVLGEPWLHHAHTDGMPVRVRAGDEVVYSAWMVRALLPPGTEVLV